MKKSNIALTLAAAMVMSAGAICPVSGEEKEDVTFTIAYLLNPLNQNENLNDQEAYRLAEEATGVHIEWIPIASADSGDKVSIMLAGDLPDAFLGLISEDQIAANMDCFLNLADGNLLADNAPHVVADYESSVGNGLDVVTWPDGSIRSLLTGQQTSYENDAEGILFINREWLNNVGLDVPTTIDEFYTAMKAFHEQDANGNGNPSDEIPFEPSQSDWCSKIMNFANTWGIAGTDSSDSSAYKMVKDGKVVGTVDTEAFRTFLEYAHMLVSEGLMDNEAFTQTSEEYHSKINQGIVGCYYTWTPYADMSESEAEKWVAISVLDDGEGNYTKTGSQDKFTASRTGFCITSACKNADRLLRWWDYLHSSTEMKYTNRFGIQGEAWDIAENGSIVELLPETLTDDFTIENYKYTYGMVDLGAYITKDESAVVLEENSFTSWYRNECVKAVHDYCLPIENQLPIRFVDPDKTTERTFIETDLFTYISNFVATSIVDGIDDKAWETHLKQLDAYQYDEWLAWYQSYMDGEF